MEIVRIFENKDTFWCVCYPEDGGQDVLTKIFTQWSDNQYLHDFFTKNNRDLKNKHWQAISIGKAVQLVREEAQFLEDKLICIEYDEPGCTDVRVSDIFKPFSKHQYVINNYEEDHFVKGKLDSLPQILRLYGVELDDGTIIISGGAIKLTSGLYRKHLTDEIDRLRTLFDYLEQQGITNFKEIEK